MNSTLQAVHLCECGCGLATVVSTGTDRAKGWERGVPRRFIKGHNLAAEARKQTVIGHESGSSQGYVRVLISKGVRQYKHILVAEKVLGRPLKRYGTGHPLTEVVHHIDGNKKNNDHTNLLICTHSYHVAMHQRIAAAERAAK